MFGVVRCLVVLSAGSQNMHSVGTCCTCKLFNALHPVIYLACDLAISFRGFTNDAAEIV